jgi:hypothetical protein
LSLLTAVRRESPLTLAREVLWRARKRWRQKHLQQKLERVGCPATYQPVGYYQTQLTQLSSDEKETILRYAEAICAGEFPWFAYGPVSLGCPPRWDLDFVSGGTWPLEASVPVVRNDGSDVKVPWELSRLQFLPPLGKAWRLSGEKRYRDAGSNLLSDWMEKNPVGLGVNWTCAMEASLRAISICLFLELVSPSPEGELPSISQVSKCLWQHLVFIEAHNEFSHLIRSNHYLSNVVGLFYLAAYLQGPKMEPRRRKYQRLIEEEIGQQVYNDGGDYEASTGYHVFCLELYTSALLLMHAMPRKPAIAFSLRLKSMYRFLAALTDPRGCVPHLGDCDDGRVELLSDDMRQMLETRDDDRYALTVSGLLGIGEALFGESYGGRTAEISWYGHVVESQEERNPRPAGQHSLVFPRSGVAVARSSDLEVVFAAMPNGIRGKGSHTHNDKLSFTMRIGSEDIFIDSGTGCYTRNAELRNYFRSTAAHNTIKVDGDEQNRIIPLPTALFQLDDDAHVSQIEVLEKEGTLSLRSSHDGYGRIGVTHTRTLTLTAQLTVIVEDVLTGVGTHRFEAFFHLPPGRAVVIEQQCGKEITCQVGGERTVKMTCRAPVDLQIACVSGKISCAYGATREATTIVVSGNFHSSVELLSRISCEG